MLADYGRSSGYGQIAPGKDISPYEEPKENGRPKTGPDINTAIMGGLPLSETPFRGAQQTLRAMPPGQVGTGGYQPWKETPDRFGGMSAPTSGVSDPMNPPQQAPPVDTSKWDTDSYAAPGYTPQNFGNAMAGWDQSKWADTNHQSPKYAIGRILNEAGSASPEHLQAAMAHIQQAYPGAQFNGKDKITIPGVGTFDVIVGASEGKNMSWAWQPEGGGGLPQQNSPLQSAIMGGAMPTVTGGADYATQLREQVMKALMNQPGLNTLAQQYMK